MFRKDRGFNISKVSHIEGVEVPLASFASNVLDVSNIPSQFPHPRELVSKLRNYGFQCPLLLNLVPISDPKFCI